MTLDEFVFTRDDIIRCQGYEEGLEKCREKGREEGREEGIAIGRRDEADRMMALNIALLSENRADDLLRASRDKVYRESLFKEFGLSYPAAEKG